jgi:hypothetical protein
MWADPAAACHPPAGRGKQLHRDSSGGLSEEEGGGAGGRSGSAALEDGEQGKAGEEGDTDENGFRRNARWAHGGGCLK